MKTREPRMPRTTLIGLAVVAAMLAVLTACSTEPITHAPDSVDASNVLRSGPQTAQLADQDVRPITDDPAITLPATAESVGHGEVTVDDVDRIVAVDRNGTLGHIVFALGLGPKVVARDTSTAFPAAEQLPTVTSQGHALVAESVLAQNPSVVLVDESTTPPEAVDQIRAAQIPVVEFSSERTIETTSTLIRAVATTLGVEQAGEQLVQRTESEIAQAAAMVPDPSGDPSMTFLYIRGERLVLMSGPASGADDLIAALGGTDAGTAAGLTGEFTAVTSEKLLAANPDVILVMTEGADSVGGLDGVLALPGVADTEAGRAQRVVQMDQTEILSFGPDIGKVLAALATAIYR